MKRQARRLVVIDAGNGEIKGLEGRAGEVLTFAPIIAPLTDKRALRKVDEQPTVSLKEEGAVLVFGLEDVEKHGDRDRARRLTSMTRYTTPDYVRLVEAMLMQLLPDDYNTGEQRPSLLMSLPVSEYNNAGTVEHLRGELRGEHRLRDYYGNELFVNIHDPQLGFIPESVGAVYHYAYDSGTLDLRNPMRGTTLVVDIGFETVNASLFENFEYIADRGYTVARGGLFSIARDVCEHIHDNTSSALDLSRVDYALRSVAGRQWEARKLIEFAPGRKADVTAVYNDAINNQVALIRDELERVYNRDRISRVLLAGGGARHLGRWLKEALLWEKVSEVPQPQHANLLGALVMLRLKAHKS